MVDFARSLAKAGYVGERGDHDSPDFWGLGVTYSFCLAADFFNTQARHSSPSNQNTSEKQSLIRFDYHSDQILEEDKTDDKDNPRA